MSPEGSQSKTNPQTVHPQNGHVDIFVTSGLNHPSRESRSVEIPVVQNLLQQCQDEQQSKIRWWLMKSKKGKKKLSVYSRSM